MPEGSTDTSGVAPGAQGTANPGQPEDTSGAQGTANPEAPEVPEDVPVAVENPAPEDSASTKSKDSKKSGGDDQPPQDPVVLDLPPEEPDDVEEPVGDDQPPQDLDEVEEPKVQSPDKKKKIREPLVKPRMEKKTSPQKPQSPQRSQKSHASSRVSSVYAPAETSLFPDLTLVRSQPDLEDLKQLLVTGVDVFDDRKVARALSPMKLAVFDPEEYKETLCELAKFPDYNMMLYDLSERRAKRGFASGIYNMFLGDSKTVQVDKNILNSAFKSRDKKFQRVDKEKLKNLDMDNLRNAFFENLMNMNLNPNMNPNSYFFGSPTRDGVN